ncbi:HsdR family type I site-specific deoxyribonuclease [Acinetobacter haemolyticus]|uniref:Type I restriction enzyme endonuclease subunit n=1 Tax=Acinetobacter guerrae TaxID=1843371 RepID=A0A3A8EMF4_9GAMM|nr:MULTISPECIES: type I restriction endonuclease subunit R [Acinetobacter]EEH67314.1 type I site-specific deoxyribonuclease, HsdR family [Acinetobacter sp. ATCC 27244]MCH7340758.1 type I restriction endonuclease subunit R [Acinetobacter higginsii]NAR50730.1 HsdR family type I site-specific deoxyribonuclease [Acinetobacter haemolyticus]NAR56998.1 HsdR family type I site-specific deoxyribonuclease [Acinetobacter haemolyticus]NAR85511.1 HsdR family type I site-specific deoxyribonuclease [Acinetob
MNETQLENLCLDWFLDNGWEVVHGVDIAPDSGNPLRKDYKQVLIEADLQAAFEHLNPHLPASCFEQVLLKLSKPDSLDLITNNRAFHHMLLEGVPVSYKKEDDWINDHAFLVDFNHVQQNRFVAINQFTILGTKQPRRPDIICFINGIPYAVLELKSPTDENADIWDAFNQLQTYKEEISDLFVFNEALVVSDGITARVGSLTASQERFLPWRTIKNEDDKPQLEWELETVIRGFFDRELFLDYIRFFVLFETDGEKTIKKIAGYHQFHAVREAVQATIAASNPTGNKKAGVVWHTQGSGKSISMCCYAGKLLQQPAMQNPTLLIVTDRNDLDGQLFETFGQAQGLLKQTPVQANNRDELRQLLAERESGGIIFTTVQKFALLDGETEHPLLNGRHNIVVMSDEAHRSQYGLKAKLSNDGTYKFGYAKHMRDALKNAAFIGFTGTPISSEDKDTRAVFGDYVSIYDIQDAVEDGATVPIYYESRLAKLDINKAEIEELSDQVDEVVEDEEDVGSREKTKGEWSRLEKLVGATPRLKQIAADLVTHFEARTEATAGKGMIVTMSREICVHLYNEIIALRPDWHDDDPKKGKIKIVMTGSASDKPLLQPHIYNKQVKKNLEKRFKDVNDPLQLVIVRDMWLTGFDAPCTHTMYIDKPMKGHNLMQAIARVNRVFKDKKGGLVVDYIGIANELKQALKTYTDAKGKGEPTLRAEEAYAVLAEKMDAIRGMFAKTTDQAGLDLSSYETQAHRLIIPAANYVLSLKDGKKRFLDLVLAVNKAFSLCGTLDEAKTLHKEIAFYSAIKAVISKHTSVDRKLSQAEKDSTLKQILDNAVVADGVADVFALCGLDKPNIGLLSDEFLEDVRQMPYRNLAVELLEKLLNDGIKAKTRNNLVQEKRFSDRLQETLRKYNNRAIETSQVIEELIQMAKEFQAEMEREASLGLNPDEIAFYDALANNESAVRELGDDTLKQIAREITEKLRKSTTVDWQVRDSVRAQLKILVRRTLQRWKYPPDKAAEAIELVMKQAEMLSNAWTK